MHRREFVKNLALLSTGLAIPGIGMSTGFIDDVTSKQNNSITLEDILRTIHKPKSLHINIRADGESNRRVYRYDIWNRDGSLKRNPDYERLLINTAQKKAYALKGDAIVKEMDMPEIGTAIEPSPPFVQKETRKYREKSGKYWHKAYMVSHQNEHNTKLPYWAGWGLIRLVDKKTKKGEHEKHIIGPTLHETGGINPFATAGCFAFKLDDLKFLYDKFSWMKEVYFTYDNVTEIIDTRGRAKLIVGNNPYSNIDADGEIKFWNQEHYIPLKRFNSDMANMGLDIRVDEKDNLTNGIYRLHTKSLEQEIKRQKVVSKSAVPPNRTHVMKVLGELGFVWVRKRDGEDVFRYDMQKGGHPNAVMHKFNKADDYGGNYYFGVSHNKITDIKGTKITSTNLAKGTRVYLSARPIN